MKSKWNIYVYWLKRILVWIYIRIYSLFLYLSLAAYYTEVDTLKQKGTKNVDIVQMIQYKQASILDKFVAGKFDEAYVQRFYEILYKADEFLMKKSPFEQAVAADRFAMNIGRKDPITGEIVDHHGFFDNKSKYAGKTLKEVVETQTKERATDDDDYDVIAVHSNKPIELGLSDLLYGIDEDNKDASQFVKGGIKYKFPLYVQRDENVINKIEMLTETLFVKKIGMGVVQLEFFIPLKFKTNELKGDDKIIKELININNIFYKEKYGEVRGYSIDRFKKRVIYKDYEVFKFIGKIMENKNIKSYG